MYNTATDQKAAKVEKQRVLHEQLSAIEDQLTTITRQMKDKINRMVESVEHKVHTCTISGLLRVLADDSSVYILIHCFVTVVLN